MCIEIQLRNKKLHGLRPWIFKISSDSNKKIEALAKFSGFLIILPDCSTIQCPHIKHGGWAVGLRPRPLHKSAACLQPRVLTPQVPESSSPLCKSSTETTKARGRCAIRVAGARAVARGAARRVRQRGVQSPDEAGRVRGRIARSAARGAACTTRGSPPRSRRARWPPRRARPPPATRGARAEERRLPPPQGR